MQETPQLWDGKAVKVGTPSSKNGKRWKKPVAINTTEEAARRLAWSLTTLAAQHEHRHPDAERHLPPEVQELLDALNFCLIGNEAARQAYIQMMNGRPSINPKADVGKGMTPDGGHRAPEGTTWLQSQAAEDATIAALKERLKGQGGPING